MNWDAIGAVGEVIGACGVIATLVYLALQIRTQILETRLNATRELARDYRRIIEKVADDPELYAIYLKALSDYEALPNDERRRIHMSFMSPVFGVHEQMYLHQSAGNVDPKFLESLHNRFAEVAQAPGLYMWWQRNREIYGDEFRSFLDEEFAKAIRAREGGGTDD